VNTLQELVSLQVGFVSLSESLELTLENGGATAGVLATLAAFKRERVKDDNARAEKRSRRSSN
jgi:putative DNA-invertase from lambdoid prophage Rac